MSRDFRTVRVTLVRSLINSNKKQRATIEALGLRRINSTAVHTETPQIRGMINKVIHLLRVEEIEEVN